jgi:hypothetical protein
MSTDRRTMLKILAGGTTALSLPPMISAKPPLEDKNRVVIDGKDIGHWLGEVVEFQFKIGQQERERIVTGRSGLLNIDKPCVIESWWSKYGTIVLGTFIAEEVRSADGHGIILGHGVNALMRTSNVYCSPSRLRSSGLMTIEYGDWVPYPNLLTTPHIGTSV